MPFSKLNLPLKIQGGGAHMVDYLMFFLSQYFECKQADVGWIFNKVSKNYCLQISCPGEGGLKGLLHILMNPIFILKNIFCFT